MRRAGGRAFSFSRGRTESLLPTRQQGGLSSSLSSGSTLKGFSFFKTRPIRGTARTNKIKKRAYATDTELSPEQVEAHWYTFLQEHFKMNLFGTTVPRGSVILLTATLVNGIFLLTIDETLRKGEVVRLENQRQYFNMSEEMKAKEEKQKEVLRLIKEKEEQGQIVITPHWKRFIRTIATPLPENELKLYREQHGLPLVPPPLEKEADDNDYVDEESRRKHRQETQIQAWNLMYGEAYYAPELNLESLSLMDLRLTTVEQFALDWRTGLMTAIAAGINGWGWAKVRASATWRNKFRPNIPMLEAMRVAKHPSYIKGYLRVMGYTCGMVGCFSALGALFVTLPVAVVWAGFKFFSGVEKVDEDTKLREVMPSEEVSKLAFFVAPVVSFTGVLWCLTHYPFILGPTMAAVALIVPLRWWHRRSLADRKTWKPDFVTELPSVTADKQRQQQQQQQQQPTNPAATVDSASVALATVGEKEGG